MAKAAATMEYPEATSSKGKAKATTMNTPGSDSKAQVDLLVKLMAQVQAQSQKLAMLKLSF